MIREIIPLFVYGTLRPGGSLHGMIEDAVIESTPARVPGALYHNRLSTDENPIYPVADFNVIGEGFVYGDILQILEGSEAFWRVDSMETNSGYRRVMVLCEVDPETEKFWAYSYQFDGLARGPKIESGDWLECLTMSS